MEIKNGFTLIELLAVIVILAIIALIATPIVLNIISNSKENAQLRSTEFYLDGVEQVITKKMMNDATFKVRDCEVQSEGNLKCDNKLEIINVEVSGEKPSSGKICLSNKGVVDKVMLKYSNYYISYDGKETKITNKDLFDDFSCDVNESKICTLAPNGDIAPEGISAGDKYLCKVKTSMEVEYENGYTFYVLSENEDGSTNLILERNACSDGTLTNSSKADKCVVAWNLNGSNSSGPVTAMDYLYNATKDWTNIQNIEMNYEDEGNTGSYGYGKIITTNNITKITKKDRSVVTVLTDQEGYKNLKARMIYKSELSEYDSTNKTNAYLYNFINLNTGNESNIISGINGYWILSSYAGTDGDAWHSNYRGNVTKNVVNRSGYYGVRPVITIKL